MIGLPVVLLAGGLGTRVSSIAGDKPKALLLLAGKPFIYWKLLELIGQGITKVYLLLGHGAKQIEQYLDSQKFSLELVIIHDKPNCGGTGQALFDSLKSIQEQQFILTYGDNLLAIPIEEFTGPMDLNHCRMVTTTNIGSADKPNANVQAGKVTAYGKDGASSYKEIDYGYSLISKACLNIYLGKNSTDLAPVFSMMADKGCLEAHSTNYGYMEIGTPTSYSQADKELRNNSQ